MGKKKPDRSFRNTPFKDLEGVSVCPTVEPVPKPVQPSGPDAPAADENFATQMAQLGVKPLDDGSSSKAHPEPLEESVVVPPDEPESDRELFLEALDGLETQFSDAWPEPQSSIRTSLPRRMKQLQRGKLRVEASLDLHGLSRREALDRTKHFFDNAAFHQLQTLLIVTGKGGHSNDGPVLRSAIEAYLQANSHRAVIEWGRAPHEHGGEGALVVFLRRSGC